MGTYSAWESTATLRLLGGARGAGAPTGEERGGSKPGHIVSPRAQLVISTQPGSRYSFTVPRKAYKAELIYALQERCTQPLLKAVNHSGFTINTTAHKANRSQDLAHCSQASYR